MNPPKARRALLGAALVAGAISATGCATHMISGQVVNRNNEPLERAVVSLEPGNVQLVSDQEGRFYIDYVRDDAGERAKLTKRIEYEVEIFQVGYHVSRTNVYYKRGELIMEPIVLKEDTIRVVGSDGDIDPGQYPDRTHSAGATYEGE
jgi:hypothetical protein